MPVDRSIITAPIEEDYVFSAAYIFSKVLGQIAQEKVKPIGIPLKIFRNENPKLTDLYNVAKSNLVLSFETLALSSDPGTNRDYEDVSIFIGCIILPRDNVKYSAKQLVTELGSVFGKIVNRSKMGYMKRSQSRNQEVYYSLVNSTMITVSVIPLRDPNIDTYWSTTITARGYLREKPVQEVPRVVIDDI